MFISYARVSTEDQTMALQKDALQAAGSGKIFEDVNYPVVQRNVRDFLRRWRMLDRGMSSSCGSSTGSGAP